MADQINIELIYALPEKQDLLTISITPGTTIEQAIQLSGILKQYPEIDLQQTKVGIFSKVTPLDTELREGDRIEIYRPLLIDPKQARIKKVAKKK